jgi:hypothetical protein
MGGCNRDVDRRHSIAIACPFVSRSNFADMKRRVINLTAQCLLQVAQPGFASRAIELKPGRRAAARYGVKARPRV